MHDLSQILKFYREGQIDPLLSEHKRQSLLDLLMKKKSDKSGQEGFLLLQAISCQLNCVMQDRRKAIRSLYPFIREDRGSRYNIDEKELHSLKGNARPFLTAIIFSQLSNTLYRLSDFERGFHCASEAENFFAEAKKGKDYKDDIDLLLFQSEHSVWLSRLEWRTSRSENALEVIERRLNSAVAALTSAYTYIENEDLLPGIDHRLALVLDLWAVLLWTSGSLDIARRRIYRALFLLRNPNIHDKVREAYALYTASRVEGSYSKRNFSWGIYLADLAIKAFRSSNHPFRVRALALKGGLLVKAGRLGEARRVLDQVEICLRKEPMKSDQQERNFAEGEWRLSRVWLYEKEAEEGRQTWESSLQEARKLKTLGKVATKRIQCEGYLHVGLALIKISELKEEGRKVLQQGIDLAQSYRLAKIEAACRAALAESLMETDRAKASLHLKIVGAILERVQSSHLENWRERLVSRIKERVALDMNQHFQEAKREFERSYLSYHFALSQGTIDEILERTGLTRSTYYRIRDKAK